jgi:hypothetical protein
MLLKTMQLKQLSSNAKKSLERLWIQDKSKRKRVASNKVGGEWTV